MRGISRVAIVWVLGLVLAVTMGACSTTAKSPATIPQYKLVVATAGVGGTGNLLASILVNMISKKSNGQIMIAVLPTPGSEDATNRLVTKEVDIEAAGSIATIYEVVKGVGAFKGKQPQKVMMLFPFQTTYTQTPVLADGNVDKWGDLVGKTVASPPQGSATATQTTSWLELAGIADKVKVVYTSWSGAVDLIKDRKAVMAYTKTGVPDAPITELAAMQPIKMVDFPQSLIDAYNKKFHEGSTVWAPLVIKKEAYPGMTRDAHLTGNMAGIFVRPDFPEEAAYWITKLVFENMPELAKVRAELALDITIENTKKFPLDISPIHPGAMRYFKEAKLW